MAESAKLEQDAKLVQETVSYGTVQQTLGGEEDGQGVYRVECLLASRPKGASREFLVRWDGYGAEADSWEAESSILDTELIAALDRPSHMNTIPQRVIRAGNGGTSAEGGMVAQEGGMAAQEGGMAAVSRALREMRLEQYCEVALDPSLNVKPGPRPEAWPLL